MAVLRAIGAFFAKIWNWIKDTAWVQPLLIVGLIFGVIFSIPSIVDGITNLVKQANAAETYYHAYQQSLVGGNDSDADKLIDYIVDRSAGKEAEGNYGDKFFLLFVSDTCSSCAEAKGGFKTLEDNFSDKLSPKEDGQFKMYTVFTDEITSDTTTKETAFVQFMDRNSNFFEDAAANGYLTDYYLNGKISDTDLKSVESCDPDNFLTPTIMLVDFTDTTPIIGVSEIMFGVTGDNDWSKAELLLNCWDHRGDFKI
ncbi:MAG: hypothetical protein MR775_00585 [Erysipelotrichaceae bacterium]|nr:hypothetical protein [Erysipelotrichaceae bacterium]